MSETSDQPPALPDAPPASAGAANAGNVSKTEMARLAYQLLLGRGPENEDVLSRQSGFADVYDLRNRFMIGGEFENQERFLRFAELVYPQIEAAFKADTVKFDAFVDCGPELENRLKEIIRDASAGSEYSTFHTTRFYDQVRAVAAIRRRVLGHIPRVRVLEVGTSPVSRMYGQVLPDIDMYTADLPAEVPPAEIAGRFGSTEHYFVNLDVEALSDRHPRLVENPFHIVLFCEVIEHVLASPQEMIGDLLKLVAPGGLLIVSTPNALDARKLFSLSLGRKSDSMYSRAAREHHTHHHIHVREYTLKELAEAATGAGGRVLLHAVKNYYADPSRNFIATKYVSAGEVQIVFVAR